MEDETMKPVVTIIISLIFGICINDTILAQSPEKMSYQAVIRDANNDLLINQPVGMQISVVQGSADGNAVYIERHFPTTNINGLVTIMIGNGTIVEGRFAEIDWSSGPYYLKTETDLNGGANYTLTATSELLSVPYALHAKTAETVTETDPEYLQSEAANITASDIVNLSNLSGINSGDQDISGIATNTQAIQDTANQIRADIPMVASYKVGDFAQGGIVFWVDETGQHGLVCAKEDQSSNARWYAGTYGSTQAKGDGPFSGEANTSIIIAVQVAIGDDGETYAARICNELQITEGGKTYSDWYLPSKEELNLMYQNMPVIEATSTANGGSTFADDYYWSSTEENGEQAWQQNFGSGNQKELNKIFLLSVRTIRAF